MTAAILVASACVDDLDQVPHIEETSESVFTKPGNYINVLAKCYSSFVLAGQEKGNANVDISGNGKDNVYMRNYFNLQECGTEEIAYTWLEGDNMANISYQNWNANDPWVSNTYYRCYYTISLCNNFLKHCTDEEISSFSQTEQATIKIYRSEARFLRALAYYHALDLFHDIPFADENTISTFKLPEKWLAPKIFNFIETELKECSKSMLDADNCTYGHAPRAAAWMLLSRLYLNAPTYEAATPAPYDSCMTYCQKVMGEGYVLESDYAKMFNADNNKRVGKGHEIIFPLVVSSTNTMTFGPTTYLICGEVDTNTKLAVDSVGCASAWSMFRVRGELPALFDMATDKRAMFYTEGRTPGLASGLADRDSGYYVIKWSNKTDANMVASNTVSDGAETDFPMFRLADAYLMYAESAARSNKNLSTALGYVNDLRTIRNATTKTESNLTETINGIPFKFFLDERARELYWECVRRTDLIRFGCFTTDKYLWQWKGGAKNGKAALAKYNIYPIPATEISANPNLSNANY
jgi:hypothetical protein